MIHFRVKRKPFYKVIDAYKNYKNWMFVNNDFTQIEILPPTLDVLKMMSDYGLTNVIKGFRNIVEYTEWDNLRYYFGTTSIFLMTRCLGTQFVSNALVSFMNNEPLPDSEDINREIENNRIILVSDKKEEKRIREREYYLKEYQRYSRVIHRKMYKLIKQGRVSSLNLLQKEISYVNE